MKNVIMAFGILVSTFARADVPPSFAEQSTLFADHSETTFVVPTKPAVPRLGQEYWSEMKRWLRVNLTVLGQAPVEGLRKTLALYRGNDGRASVLEATFHPHGPLGGHYWTEGDPQSDRFLFYSGMGDKLYKEDCRPLRGYLVCRVTNQDGAGHAGFVAYLNYVPW